MALRLYLGLGGSTVLESILGVSFGLLTISLYRTDIPWLKRLHQLFRPLHPGAGKDGSGIPRMYLGKSGNFFSNSMPRF